MRSGTGNKSRKVSASPSRAAMQEPFVVRDSGECVVNGGVMEGGGQILRNTVALAAVLGKELCVVNIRANRPRGGGLRAQHLNGIELVAQLHSAKLTGGAVGSTEITFKPKPFRADLTNATADTRTAGSICLLAQIGLPCAIFGSTSLTMTLRGGTNATQAPPYEYLEHVTLPTLARMGVVANLQLKRRGFFPKGGGEVLLIAQPMQQCIQPIRLVGERGAIRRVTVRAFHTPPSVEAVGVTEQNVRQAVTQKYGPAVECVLVLEAVKGAIDRASGVTAVAESENGLLFGCTELAEDKSREPLLSLIHKALDALARNAPPQEHWVCVDEYLQDQLVIFAALARGTSAWQTGPITTHTKTAIYFCGQMSGAQFRVFRVDEAGARHPIDVATDDTDYERTAPNSRFLIECDGIAFGRFPQLK